MQACFNRAGRVAPSSPDRTNRSWINPALRQLCLGAAWLVYVPAAPLLAQEAAPEAAPAAAPLAPLVPPPAGPAAPPAAPAKLAADAPDADAAASPEGAPSGSAAADLRRTPRRPTLTDDEYKSLAAYLRTAYAKPPAEWPKPEVDEPERFQEIGTLPAIKYPEDNPGSQAKVDLGAMLFFDPRLSRSHQMACASCHEPDLTWADGRTVAFGNRRVALTRNTPSLLTSGYGTSFFWDGRADSLEKQAHDVLLNHQEMDGEEAVVLRRLRGSPAYVEKFKAVFADPEINLVRVGQAIATYLRAVAETEGPTSRFDLFVRSGKQQALNDEAVRGLHLFRTTARCINCHNGPNFTDDRFHNLGLSYYGRKLQDLGRYEVTHKPEDVGAFKTPSLRGVAQTAPYMHTGLFRLPGVLNLYNAGMPTLRRRADQAGDPLFPTKSPLLKPLGLNAQDMKDLTAFLEALNPRPRRVRPPELPPLDEAD